MFRPMRRIKQQISQDECMQILKNEIRGVLAIHGEDGYPYAFPMNHIYLDGKLYFHSAKQGHKIDVLASNNKVSFCVMDKGFCKKDDWSLNINSVVVFGQMKIVEDEETAIEIIRKLAIKNYPKGVKIEKVIIESKNHFHIFQLDIDHMTGKLVNEA